MFYSKAIHKVISGAFMNLRKIEKYNSDPSQLYPGGHIMLSFYLIIYLEKIDLSKMKF